MTNGTKTAKVQLGTIIHGTLRTADLLEALYDTLFSLNPDDAVIGDMWEATAEYDTWEAYCAACPEEAEIYVDELIGALRNDHALDYCYFGSHEGDGADFGFWVDWDAIDDDRHSGELRSGDELPENNTGHFLIVNDHGNATLYFGETVIWAVV